MVFTCSGSFSTNCICYISFSVISLQHLKKPEYYRDTNSDRRTDRGNENRKTIRTKSRISGSDLKGVTVFSLSGRCMFNTRQHTITFISLCLLFVPDTFYLNGPAGILFYFFVLDYFIFSNNGRQIMTCSVQTHDFIVVP